MSVDPTGSGASLVASLQLISGQSGDGEVLAEADTGGGDDSSSRLSDVFLPTGHYSIEATGPATGSYGYDDEHRPLMKITDGSTLLGVHPADATLEAAVKAPDGTRHIKRFTDGTEQDPKPLALNEPIKHRISPNVAILAPDGKHHLVKNTNIAQPDKPEQSHKNS